MSKPTPIDEAPKPIAAPRARQARLAAAHRALHEQYGVHEEGLRRTAGRGFGTPGKNSRVEVDEAVADVRDDIVHAAFGFYDLSLALGLEKWQARPIAKYGVALLQQNDDDGAHAAAQVAVQLDDACFEAQLLAGVCWARKKELARALSHYIRAQRLQPACLQAWVDAAEIRLGLGQYGEAAADFRRAFELDPAGTSPFTQRAMVLVAKTLNTVNN